MPIHPTAIVASGASIDPSVDIGPWTLVDDDVTIHADVSIGPSVRIFRGTEIGAGTAIHSGAVIGDAPQDYKYDGARTFTRIGERNVIREFVTIHRGTEAGSATTIGSGNMLMVSSHVAHNCTLADDIILANGALLAGHVEVGSRAFISGNVIIHQFCRLGELCMIGGFSGANKDVTPYTIIRGPSTVRGVNVVGMRRAGFDRDAIREIKEAYRLYFMAELGETEALDQIRERFDSAPVHRFTKFVEASKRGVSKYRYRTEEFFD